MGLPDPIRRFCYSVWGLEAGARRVPWGMVTADPRHPSVWDANNACILEPDPDLRIADIRAELRPLLARAHVDFEHLEFWESSRSSPALRELRAGASAQPADAVMVLVEDGMPPSRTGTDPVAVEEVGDPDASLWAWYRDGLREFDGSLPDRVLDQMTERAKDVFHPAGLTWFVARESGEPVGYSSVLSLGGVAYLDNVVTMPEHRNRGIATATVGAAVRARLDAGDDVVFLLAEEGGAPKRLYESLGFRTRARVETFHMALPD